MFSVDIEQDSLALLDEYKKFYETSLKLLNNKPAHQSNCDEIISTGKIGKLKYFRSAKADASPILIIPSVINKSDILDINPSRSLCNFLKAHHHIYLLDWSSPIEDFTASTYIEDIIKFARLIHKKHRRQVNLMGYCLGGNLAIASYFHLEQFIDKMVFVATPWDFSKLNYQAPQMLKSGISYIPSALITLFINSINSDKIIEKYLTFQDKVLLKDDRQLFFQVEHWTNNGLNLSYSVAKMILEDFYNYNLTFHGRWKIKDMIIDARQIKTPCLVITTNNDRIVSHQCSSALASFLPKATLIESSLGHVGVIISKKSDSKVWQPIIKWLREI